MYQGNSENNLLINKQRQQQEQYNFNQSFVMAPIKLNPTNFNPNLKARQMNALNKGGSLGNYQKYKLTEYLGNGFSGVEKTANINLAISQALNNGTVIDVITIDSDSNVGRIGSNFVQVMNRYSTHVITFVAFMGQQKAGKSFFLDKILNLAEIKGNNYCYKTQPGIYMYSTPFIKDGLCIFFLQLSGCKIYSDMFKLLNVICLGLSTSIVYLAKDDDVNYVQKDWISFIQTSEKCRKAFQFQQLSQQDNIKIPYFYHISRTTTKQQNLEINSLQLFQSKKKLYLPNAAAPTFKDTPQNLAKCSFLSKQCVNSEYIKQISQIFKQIYNQIPQKRYNELVISGNIVNKLVKQFLKYLNSHKNIPIVQVYQSIIKQLYVSAYNYCVISYHDELQVYFEDQQPKNSNNMYEAFEAASQKAITKFNQFNLNKGLHQQYLQKLFNHIQMKQKLLCSINKQKTYDFLLQRFQKISKGKNDKAIILNLLKNQRNDLDDGRAQALQSILISMLGNSPDYAALQKLQKMAQEKKRLMDQISNVARRNKQEQQNKRKKYEELQKTEQQYDKQLKKIQNEIAIGESKIDAATVDKLRAEIQKLKQNEIESTQKLRNYKNQNNEGAIAQVSAGYQQRIQQKTRRLEELNKQLEQIVQKNKQNPQTKSPVKQKQPAASKMKQSEVKKQQKTKN